ncbi:hypothetical protein HIM_04412 [Hirsutella minnesotensis 3608]|uniref:Uncharacterized protein n=1 Tax=Hirsutella minnesotensis 3608 TaxID=1043627 RepID=A0A0F7ZPY9_9HYPO|nr:hypothetical protein HIM_04412 [Hirsutella minnesotensis 3608]
MGSQGIEGAGSAERDSQTAALLAPTAPIQRGPVGDEGREGGEAPGEGVVAPLEPGAAEDERREQRAAQERRRGEVQGVEERFVVGDEVQRVKLHLFGIHRKPSAGGNRGV